MTNRGEAIAGAVREYLVTNGLKQSHLTGKILAEIANRVLAHIDNVEKKKRRLASEEDWIKELEGEPHLAGVNVRKELAAAQFWAKNNDRLCTRKFFIVWLGKAVRNVIVSPGGEKKQSLPPNVGPKGWLAKLNELHAGSTLAQGGRFEIETESDYQWQQLDAKLRDELRKAL